MPLTGDFAKLQRIVAETQRAGRQGMAVLGKALAEEARTQVLLGFRSSTAPDGSAWASLRVRAGKPLIDTGRMQNSVSARGNAAGIVVSIGFEHASTHQFGATIVPRTAKRLAFPGPGGKTVFAKRVVVPARPMLPTGPELPARWASAFAEAADEVLTLMFGAAAE